MLSRLRGSLIFRLTISLIGFQFVVFLVVITAIALLVGVKSASTIDEQVVNLVADSIELDAGGQLVLADTDAVRKLRETPTLWVVAKDLTGRELRVGSVPAVYEGLVGVLTSLHDSGVWARQDAAALASRLLVKETPFGEVHVLVGGVPTAGAWAIFKIFFSIFGLRLMLPLAIVSLCIVPWLTTRALKGVSRAARQAETINIRQRDAQLSEDGIASEVRPLVRAVNDALTRLNEGYDARDRFLAGAAHELRAPIAILEARVGNLEPGASRSRLLADVSRLSNLAETLLDLQRLGRKLSDLKPVELSGLARRVASDMAPLVLNAGYDIEVNAGQPVHVAGDALALGRAVINLLQNAISHAGGHGLISLDVHTDGTLCVRDQGPGVPVEERERIFEPFHRIHPSDRGTGLGLHLVREIVELHGGTVEVAQVPTGGACFKIRLPVLPPTAKARS